jgi:hypothetical protein
VTGFPKVVRDIVTRRAGDHCERCGVDRPEQLHHRRPRGMGGSSRDDTNTAANCLALCVGCHQHIESNRKEALSLGWLVHQGDTPEHAPVFRRGQWCWLTADGSAGSLTYPDDPPF